MRQEPTHKNPLHSKPFILSFLEGYSRVCYAVLQEWSSSMAATLLTHTRTHPIPSTRYFTSCSLFFLMLAIYRKFPGQFSVKFDLPLFLLGSEDVRGSLPHEVLFSGFRRRFLVGSITFHLEIKALFNN